MTNEQAEYLENADYSEEVVSMIRMQYSANDELAILRQRDTKPDEFAEYNTYCEGCKTAVRAKIAGAAE